MVPLAKTISTKNDFMYYSLPTKMACLDEISTFNVSLRIKYCQYDTFGWTKVAKKDTVG